MYPGYEKYWTSIQTEPGTPVWITGAPPTPAELDWARFAKSIPHYVLSSTLTSAAWPNTKFIRSMDDITGLKRQTGKDIYLMGGGRIMASLIDAGLVDELRLIVFPLIAGVGKPLFAATKPGRGLELRDAKQLAGGRVSLIYGIR